MKKINLVIFDWAGTAVDYGCFAPVQVFLEIFKEKNIDVTLEEARGPMGMLKIDHIKAMLSLDRVTALWNENDIEELYKNFENKLFKILADYTEPVPHCIETVNILRERGLKIGSTTGYTQEMMDIVTAGAKSQGYSPDYYTTPNAVPAGRPAPYMIYQNMLTLGEEDTDCVIKIGDTISDIKEGRNAKVWTVGILKGSSELGLSLEEVNSLSEKELKEKMEKTAEKMLSTGAHFVIEDISKVPYIIDIINNKLKNGERA